MSNDADNIDTTVDVQHLNQAGLPFDSHAALTMHKCPQCGFVHTHKFAWDWGKFWKGKFDNKLFAYLITVAIISVVLFTKGVVSAEKNEFILIICWGVATGIYMLAGAIDNAVSNMKINAELKAGASINKGGSNAE